MADIPVYESDAGTHITVTVNGQTSFSFDFLIYRAEQLRVLYYAGGVGPSVELDYPADFSVSGLANPMGGTFDVIGLATTAGDRFYAWRSTPIEREHDWQNEGDYKADLVNAEQDQLFMIQQELRRDLALAVSVGPGETPPTIGQIDGWVEAASNSAAAALQSENNAAASELSAAGSAGAAATSQGFAYDWSSAAEDAPVNDGVRSGFSAYHWAAKAAALVTGGVAAAVHGATAKPTPADADEFALVDSADGWSLKKLTWANIKAALSSVFLPKAGGTMTGLLTLAPSDDDPNGTASLNIPAGADTPDVQADGDLWADSSEDLRYRRGGEDAAVYDSVNLPRPSAGEITAGMSTEPRAPSAKDLADAVAAHALSIGVGQTWQDVSGSRAADTSYQNTTGKPIYVTIAASAGTRRDIEVSPDGTSGWVAVGSTTGGGTGVILSSFVVPAGHYYRINGTGSFTIWSELR